VKKETRKFTNPNFVRNNDDGVESESNSDLIVGHASSLKALAIVVDQATEVAREALNSSRNSVGEQPVVTNADNNTITKRYTDSDLALNQNIVSSQINEQISRAVIPGVSLDGLRDSISATTNSVIEKSISNVLKIREQAGKQPVNNVVPQVDHVAVEIDKTKGTVDCFFSRITFNLPRKSVESGDVCAVRIFRAVDDDPEFMKGRPPLSLYALEILSTLKRSNRSKTFDSVSKIEKRMIESKIENSLSKLNPIDPIRNVRVSVDGSTATRQLSSTTKAKADDVAESTISQFLIPDAFANVDKSVINDLKSLRNIQIQNPTLRVAFESDSIIVGRKTVGAASGLGDAQASTFASVVSNVSNFVIEKNNAACFKEIAFIPPDKMTRNIIGDTVEYTFDDESISYGKSYSYYILSVDKNMQESVRSKIVTIDVDGFRVPECPRRVNTSVQRSVVSLAMSVEDKLIEKFEIYRKETDRGFVKPEVRNLSVISGRSGMTLEKVARVRQQNNFIQIGESFIGSMGSSTFFDRSAIPGMKYTYRVYSVDIFGNKSECPRELELYIPEPQLKQNELRKPTMTVEVDSKTNKMKITFSSDDSRIKSFFIERRDLTIGQLGFSIPGAPSRTIFGNPDVGRSSSRFDGPKLSDGDRSLQWNGHFENDGEEITFIDVTSQVEHTYQYRVYGVDRFGNISPYDVSRPVFVANRPMVNAPVNLSSSLVYNANGDVQGVRLTWDNGNNDVNAEERLGSRSALNDTIVRSLFQIERRRVGEERWLEFPLIEETTFFDRVQDGTSESQLFRPEYLKLNERYIYRIEAIQSGAYISNFSSPIEVFVGSPVARPSNFKISPADTKIRPFYVTLNWDTPAESGVVDRWEIERAEVNNFAAVRLNFRDTSQLDRLDFKKFRTVFRESSRGKSFTSDDKLYKAVVGIPNGVAITNKQIKLDVLSDKVTVKSALTSGQHSFSDSSVRFGNTYVYRIRAVSPDNEESQWVYRGVKVADDVFEKKLSIIISDDEKIALSKNLVPLAVKNDMLNSFVEKSNTTLSLVPSFAKSGTRPVSAKPAKHEVAVKKKTKEKVYVDTRKK
jgi:hypothetical protein